MYEFDESKINTTVRLPDYRKVINEMTWRRMWAPPGTPLEPMPETARESMERHWRMVDRIALALLVSILVVVLLDRYGMIKPW
jgi:hypothetical protein